MTKKFNRETAPVFHETGEFVGVRYRFNNAAYLNITDGNEVHVRIEIENYWFGVSQLERLIAELIYIKEDLENHPNNLAAQQAEDMEEIDVDFEDEDDQDHPEDAPIIYWAPR